MAEQIVCNPRTTTHDSTTAMLARIERTMETWAIRDEQNIPPGITTGCWASSRATPLPGTPEYEDAIERGMQTEPSSNRVSVRDYFISLRRSWRAGR